MTQTSSLGLRTLAATRLAEVQRGNPFAPFAEGDIADARDRAFANRLVTLALRRAGHLDLILAERLQKGPPKRSGLLLALLHLGLADLLYGEGADHAAVNETVAAIKADRRAQPFASLANAILRGAQREADRYHALDPVLLFPPLLRDRWRTFYGEAALSRFAEALLAGAPLDLTLTKKADPATLGPALDAVPTLLPSMRLQSRDRAVDALPGYEQGQWLVQDLASSLPARLFGLPQGASVLDLCAAPGGKTAQLADQGYRVTALDLSDNRLDRVRANLSRLGLAAQVQQGDALTFRPPAPVDGVLLDAPCTATGTFRRHPDVLAGRSVAAIADRARLQRDMLDNALACLKPGGILIYCTCSLEPEEGEDQAAFLAASGRVKPKPVGDKELPGLAGAVSKEGYVRLHPGLDLPGGIKGSLDGFFIARFVRV